MLSEAKRHAFVVLIAGYHYFHSLPPPKKTYSLVTARVRTFNSALEKKKKNWLCRLCWKFIFSGSTAFLPSETYCGCIFNEKSVFCSLVSAAVTYQASSDISCLCCRQDKEVIMEKRALRITWGFSNPLLTLLRFLRHPDLQNLTTCSLVPHKPLKASPILLQPRLTQSVV